MLATAQHGVASAQQLLEAGLTRRQIEVRLRAGRLHAVGRGVYAVGHTVLSREGRWMAAVLSCGPDAVLSHRAAAAHWQMLPPSAASIDVTLPRRTGRCRRAGIAINRVRSLMDDERTVHDGIAVTTVQRTLVDLAALGRRRTVERAVEESERRRLVDLGPIWTLLERQPRRPGAPLLREVIGSYREEHLRTRMELERLS